MEKPSNVARGKLSRNGGELSKSTKTSQAQKSNPEQLVDCEFSPSLQQRLEIQPGITDKKEKIEKHVGFRMRNLDKKATEEVTCIFTSKRPIWFFWG